MKNNKIEKQYPDFIIYEAEGNTAKVSVRLTEETVWLTQKQLAEIFDTTRENVVQHIKNIRSWLKAVDFVRIPYKSQI